MDILSFVPDESGEVTLNCDWTLLEGAPAHSVVSRTAHLMQAGGDTPSGEAHAMSELLGKLADQIATAVSQETESGTGQK